MGGIKQKNVKYLILKVHIVKVEFQCREEKQSLKFSLAPMGVHAPGSAHVRPSARPPINTSRNFPSHMSGGRGVKLS